MLYTDMEMPEIRDPQELLKLGAQDRLVVIESRWKPGHLGLTQPVMDAFEPMLVQPQGGDRWLLMKRKETR